jgi:hypothetical protein
LAKGGEIVYLVFAMWEERKDVMSWQSSLDVAGLQEEDKYKKNAQQYKFKHRGPMFQARVPCEIRWTNIRSFGGTGTRFSSPLELGEPRGCWWRYAFDGGHMPIWQKHARSLMAMAGV